MGEPVGARVRGVGENVVGISLGGDVSGDLDAGVGDRVGAGVTLVGEDVN